MLNPIITLISANQCLKTVNPTAMNLFKPLSYLQWLDKGIFFCGNSLGAALGSLQPVCASCLLAQGSKMFINLLPCYNGPTGFSVGATGVWGHWSVFFLGFFLNTRVMGEVACSRFLPSSCHPSPQDLEQIVTIPLTNLLACPTSPQFYHINA